jgi:hypothetical protein
LIGSTQEWLPLDALADPRIVEAAKPIVEQWSLRWFGREAYGVGKAMVQRSSGSAHLSKAEWRSFDGAAFVDWSDEKGMSLARMALDAPAGLNDHGSVDKKLMTRLAEDMVEDLSQALQKAWKLPGLGRVHPFSVRGGLKLQLAEGKGAPSFWIAVPAEELVPFCKSLIATPRAFKTIDCSFEDAFDSEKLSYAVYLGTAPISAGDLCALAEGDILVLDTALSDPVPFISQKSGRTIGKANVSGEEGKLQLLATVD